MGGREGGREGGGWEGGGVSEWVGSEGGLLTCQSSVFHWSVSPLVLDSLCVCRTVGRCLERLSRLPPPPAPRAGYWCVTGYAAPCCEETEHKYQAYVDRPRYIFTQLHDYLNLIKNDPKHLLIKLEVEPAVGSGLSIVKNPSRRTAPKFGTHVRIDTLLKKNLTHPTRGGFRGLNCLARLALARERMPTLYINLRRSHDGKVFVCSCMRLCVTLAPFSSLWPAVSLTVHINTLYNESVERREQHTSGINTIP